FMALYQKANAEYELGNYAQTKNDYTRLKAINPRSAEALTGLARVAVQENNLGMAQQYMDDAVAMMPADSDIYVRRSSVRRMLGNNTGAVDDLVMAISIDSNPKAFQELTNLAAIDYPAVITGLSNAVSHAPEQGMFYYIRAAIAQAHHHFMPAVTDYKKIINDNLYSYPGIYNDLAECYLALCKYNDATDNVRHAIGMHGDNRPFYLTLGKIQLAEGKPANALINIDRTLDANPENIDALIQKGICLYSLGRFDEASTIFGEMVMDNPQNYYAYMLQAWGIADGLKDPASALPVYRRLIDATADEDKPDHTPSLTSYRGFALLFAGKKQEALDWAARLTAQPDSDGSFHYLAACLYAQASDNAKAMEAAEVALKRGYADLYQWRCFDAARINVAPLRKGSSFTDLLAKYSYLFE
ncbi:MAG: tetratricopeptide repeat protein, partial [Muribaculaceae bacterium]|nr:tetratricopeptide repeat protein [Muribaculaceae bacterium]